MRSNKVVNLCRSPAGAQSTNVGQQNADGMEADKFTLELPKCQFMQIFEVWINCSCRCSLGA